MNQIDLGALLIKIGEIMRAGRDVPAEIKSDYFAYATFHDHKTMFEITLKTQVDGRGLSDPETAKVVSSMILEAL